MSLKTLHVVGSENSVKVLSAIVTINADSGRSTFTALMFETKLNPNILDAKVKVLLENKLIFKNEEKLYFLSHKGEIVLKTISKVIRLEE